MDSTHCELRDLQLVSARSRRSSVGGASLGESLGEARFKRIFFLNSKFEISILAMLLSVPLGLKSAAHREKRRRLALVESNDSMNMQAF